MAAWRWGYGMSPFEDALVVRAASGADDRAFSRLVAMHQAAVRGFLRRLTGSDAALADDLAQDTFLTAYRRLASFRGDSSFRAWLMRIAYRAFLQHRRRPARREVSCDMAAYLAGQAAAAVPMAARLDIENALARLPEAERVALSLCFTYGLSHEEAARATDQPLGTLKSQVARGKARLKEILAVWQTEKAS